MALEITAAIVAVVVFLLLCRVKVAAAYDEKFTAKISYLFFTFDLGSDSAGKKREKKKRAKDEKKKKPDIAKIISILGDYSDIFRKLLTAARHRVRIDTLRFRLAAAGADAAEAAILYGRACAAVYPCAGLIGSAFEVRDYDIAMRPDFTAEKSTFSFGTVFSVRLGSAVGLGFRGLFMILGRAIGSGMKKTSVVHTAKNNTVKDGVSK
jgi:hypothetical protein